MSDVTQILSQIEDGDGQAAEKLLPLVYDELRRLAAKRIAQEKPGNTLQSTELVHEAYLRLVDQGKAQDWNSRWHFFAAAAEAMRRILIEHARKKQRHRHGGRNTRVALDDADLATTLPPDELLVLNEAIDTLAFHDRVAADLVKVRYFTGLSVKEAAEAMGISRSTAYEHWTYARAWLFSAVPAIPRRASPENLFRFFRTSVPRMSHFLLASIFEVRIMDADPAKTKEIFLRALRCATAEEREAYIEEACGEDSQLRQSVAILLEAHEQAGSFLQNGALAADPTIDQPITEGPGTVIGPYKLLQQIGEGGMGVVYMAEQTEPVERRAALKIIKPGMDTRQVIARFEAERQALAMLDHPNIAKVLDAGTTDSGRPYFVMDLVKGIAVTKYCDEQHLTPNERLELFIPICQAVQHAHQKGIIHRDIKPSNILVALYDGQPVPKVIDFGVAKATTQKLTEKTVFTRYGQIVGTLEYMSPEQANLNQLDIDTRSDIYSLGVVLYELLTGATPFDRERLRSAAFEEMLRIIREEEPPKPSIRLSTIDTLPSVAASRKSEPRKLSTMVRGELDWIVMKALDKDRARRYETANAFAEDIQRYLKDEAVIACPPSAVYRFRKFVRRNKGVLTTISLLGVVLLLGTVISTSLAVLANRRYQGEQEARRTADDAQKRTETALASETTARRELHRNLYVAHMNMAQHYWESADLMRMRDLLNQWLPKDNSEDLRGFEWHYWWRLAHPTVLTLSASKSEVLAVAFSPDGKTLASCGGDRTVQLWDIATGELTGILQHHNSSVWGLGFSPDGKTLASAGEPANETNGQLILWDLPSGEPRFVLPQRQRIFDVDFSPDGKMLAAGARRELTLWDAATGNEIRKFVGNSGMIGDISFSPNGQTLASATRRQGIELWDVATGRLRQTIAGGGRCMAFSPDGSELASGGPNAEIRLWDVESGKLIQDYLGHKSPATTIDFSSDSTLLASGSGDRTVKLWDLSTQHEIATLKGHGHWIRSVAFSPDGRWLASGSADGMVKMWPLDVPELPSHIGLLKYGHSIAFSPDSKTLAAEGLDGAVRLYDPDTGNLAATIPMHPQSAAKCVRFSPEGRLLASGSPNGYVKVWNLEEGKLEQVFSGYKYRWNWCGKSVAFSPDGEWLAFVGDGGDVKVCEVSSGEELSTLGTASDRAACIAFAPEGVSLAAGGTAGVLRLWNVDSGTEKAVFEGHPEGIKAVAFSPDGKLLATGSGDRTVTLWRVATGERAATFRGFHSPVCGLAFSPCRKTLAAVTWAGTITLWNLKTGKLLTTIEELGTGAVQDLTFSPDGTRLAFRSSSTAVILRAATEDEVRVESRAPLHKATISLIRANANVQQEKLQQAIAEYTQAIESDPTMPLAWGRRGDCHAAIGQYDRAVRDFTMAIDLGLKDPTLRLRRVDSYLRLRQFDEAVAGCSTALKLQPDSVDFLRKRAEAYCGLEEYRAAADDMARVTELRPTVGSFWLERARVLLAAERTSEYYRLCKELLERDGKSEDPQVLLWVPAYFKLASHAKDDLESVVEIGDKVVASNFSGSAKHANLGAVLYRAGRYEEALHRLGESCKITRSSASVLFLAMSHWQLGHKDQARRLLAEGTGLMDERLADQPWGKKLWLPMLRREAEQMTAEEEP